MFLFHSSTITSLRQANLSKQLLIEKHSKEQLLAGGSQLRQRWLQTLDTKWEYSAQDTETENTNIPVTTDLTFVIFIYYLPDSISSL